MCGLVHILKFESIECGKCATQFAIIFQRNVTFTSNSGDNVVQL